MRALGSLLALAVVALALAGAVPPTVGPTAPASAPAPASHVAPPAVPTDDSPDAAAAFAAGFERAAAYNRRLGPGVVDVNATCESAFDRGFDGGYYAVAACAGSVERAVGGERLRDGFVDRPAVYRVADGAFDRVPLDEARVLGPGPAAATGDRPFPRGAAVVNFANEAANVSVRLTRRTADGERTVFAGEESVAPTDALVLERAIRRSGTYRLSVAVEGASAGAAETYEWNASAGDRRSSHGAVAYVSPSGALDVGPYPAVCA